MNIDYDKAYGWALWIMALALVVIAFGSCVSLTGCPSTAGHPDRPYYYPQNEIEYGESCSQQHCDCQFGEMLVVMEGHQGDWPDGLMCIWLLCPECGAEYHCWNER